MKYVEYLETIAKEVRVIIETYKGQGLEGTELRKAMINSLDATAQVAFRGEFLKIITNPSHGFDFAFKFHESLGGVNVVMEEEHLAPVHIKEVPFMAEVLVKTIEETANKDIDDIFSEMHKIREQQLKESDGEY